MSAPVCSQCLNPIPADDVNVAKDVAYCRACNRATPLSGLVHDETAETALVDVAAPPRGCWRRDNGVEIEIGVSHRSLASFLVAFFIAAFWNGILSIFLGLCFAAWWVNITGDAPPAWLPQPIMNGSHMGWGMTIFLTAFLSPFLLIGLILLGIVLMTLAGTTVIRIRAEQGTLRTGIGPLGRTVRFEPASVTDVVIQTQQRRGSKGEMHKSTRIHIKTPGKDIDLGLGLTRPRRNYIAAALRHELVA